MRDTRIETAGNSLPEPLKEKFLVYWQQWLDNGLSLAGSSDNVCRTLPKVWSCSDFVARFCLRYPEKYF